MGKQICHSICRFLKVVLRHKRVVNFLKCSLVTSYDRPLLADWHLSRRYISQKVKEDLISVFPCNYAEAILISYV